MTKQIPNCLAWPACSPDQCFPTCRNNHNNSLYTTVGRVCTSYRHHRALMHKPCDIKGKCHTTQSSWALDRLSHHLGTHKSSTENVGVTSLGFSQMQQHHCYSPKLPDNFKCLASVKAAAKAAFSQLLAVWHCYHWALTDWHLSPRIQHNVSNADGQVWAPDLRKHSWLPWSPAVSGWRLK